MHDTSFIMPAEKFDRMVSRQTGSRMVRLKERHRALPLIDRLQWRRRLVAPTACDYIKFTDDSAAWARG